MFLDAHRRRGSLVALNSHHDLRCGQNAGASSRQPDLPETTVAACATVEPVGNERSRAHEEPSKAFAHVAHSGLPPCFIPALPQLPAQGPHKRLHGTVFERKYSCQQKRGSRRGSGMVMSAHMWLSGDQGHRGRAGARRPETSKLAKRNWDLRDTVILSSDGAAFSRHGIVRRHRRQIICRMDFTIPAVRGAARKIKGQRRRALLINITNTTSSRARAQLYIWACPRPCSAPAFEGLRHLPIFLKRAGAPDRHDHKGASPATPTGDARSSRHEVLRPEAPACRWGWREPKERRQRFPLRPRRATEKDPIGGGPFSTKFCQ